MGRRSAEEAENHWPGFVDALSTIVMVVTFLLIILAIAIFVLSQSIAKSYIESQSVQTNQGGGDLNNAEQLDASNEFENEKQPDQADPESSASSQTAAAGGADTKAEVEADQVALMSQKDSEADSSFNPQLAEELKSSESPEIGKDLAVISREILDEELRVVIATPDQAEETEAETRVTQAASILTLQFDAKTTKIDETSSGMVSEFLASNRELLRDREIVIWAFSSAESMSISEARRVAYYRALAARNELITDGIPPENINVEIRFAESGENRDTVQIMVRR